MARSIAHLNTFPKKKTKRRRLGLIATIEPHPRGTPAPKRKPRPKTKTPPASKKPKARRKPTR